jgi:hypothetical protein
MDLIYVALYLIGMFFQTRSLDKINQREKKLNLNNYSTLSVITFLSFILTFIIFCVNEPSLKDFDMFLNPYIYLLFILESSVIFLYKKVYKENVGNFTFISASLLSTIYLMPIISFLAYNYFGIESSRTIYYDNFKEVLLLSASLFLVSLIYSYDIIKRTKINNVKSIILLNIVVLSTLFGSSIMAQNNNPYLYFSSVSLVSSLVFYILSPGLKKDEIFVFAYIPATLGALLTISFVFLFPVEIISNVKRGFQLLISKFIDFLNGSSISIKDISFISFLLLISYYLAIYK